MTHGAIVSGVIEPCMRQTNDPIFSALSRTWPWMLYSMSSIGSVTMMISDGDSDGYNSKTPSVSLSEVISTFSGVRERVSISSVNVSCIWRVLMTVALLSRGLSRSLAIGGALCAHIAMSNAARRKAFQRLRNICNSMSNVAKVNNIRIG